jgi:hypothetical protein
MAAEVAAAVVFGGATPDTGSTRNAAIKRTARIRVGEQTIRIIHFNMGGRDIMVNDLCSRSDT